MRPENSTDVPAQGSSPPGDLAQRLLTQVVLGRRCQRAILAVLQEVQLTDTQLLVLWGIDGLAPSHVGQGIGQSEVAQSLGISPAQISGLVEQLRQQDDLDCQRAAHDRRQQLWQLTDTGRQRLRRALECLASLNFELLCWPEASVPSVSIQQGEAA